jgi:hypothetical protein
MSELDKLKTKEFQYSIHRKLNENISATEKALRLEAKKEADRVAKIRLQEGCL